MGSLKSHAKDEVKPRDGGQSGFYEYKDQKQDFKRRPGDGDGPCNYGCCGSFSHGQCPACCSRAQAKALETIEPRPSKDEMNPNEERQNHRVKDEANAEADVVVGPQQIGFCRFGCCGGFFFNRCAFCCRRPQAEADVVEPQQRWGGGGCRYGCCGSYAYGQCSACCAKKIVMEQEAKP